MEKGGKKEGSKTNKQTNLIQIFHPSMESPQTGTLLEEFVGRGRERGREERRRHREREGRAGQSQGRGKGRMEKGGRKEGSKTNKQTNLIQIFHPSMENQTHILL